MKLTSTSARNCASIQIQPSPGDDLVDLLQRAFILARTLGLSFVNFVFNGEDFTVYARGHAHSFGPEGHNHQIWRSSHVEAVGQEITWTSTPMPPLEPPV